jgi:hypothetical protein
MLLFQLLKADCDLVCLEDQVEKIRTRRSIVFAMSYCALALEPTCGRRIGRESDEGVEGNN